MAAPIASPAPRVKSALWVEAHIRRCRAAGLDAYLRRRGDGDAGQVFLKIAALDGTATVLSQAIDGAGERVWLRATGAAPVADGAAEAYLARQLRRDPDAFVVEIEDRNGRHALDEPVV
jgi:hypothetical protein